METVKDALQYLVELGVEASKPDLLEICGKTYANRELIRYGETAKAKAVHAGTLSAMVEYIGQCSGEFPEEQKMLVHIVSPKEVRLMSSLDKERTRECLFVSEAEVSEFRFDAWYSQERFMIELQANFQKNEDLEAVMRLAGNIEKKNQQTYSDDGVTQVATMSVGVAAKADAMVPNPVELIPFRTFQEVAQPPSRFVFRIGDQAEPQFKIVEAEGGIWKNAAICNIKKYLIDAIGTMPDEIRDRIIVIG